jgi:hypothetical protein
MEIDDLKKRNDVALEKNSRKEDKKLIRLENEVEKLRVCCIATLLLAADN